MEGLPWRDYLGGIALEGLPWRDCLGGIALEGSFLSKLIYIYFYLNIYYKKITMDIERKKTMDSEIKERHRIIALERKERDRILQENQKNQKLTKNEPK